MLDPSCIFYRHNDEIIDHKQFNKYIMECIVNGIIPDERAWPSISRDIITQVLITRLINKLDKLISSQEQQRNTS